MRMRSMALAIAALFGLLAQQVAFAGSAAQGSTSATLNSLLNQNKGRVLVLLLGMEGCAETAKATEWLDAYVKSKPGKVSVLRLDVPLPGKTATVSSTWSRSFPRKVDIGRKVAGKLDFFYYPTVYVFDTKGRQRYVGALDQGKFAGMVREILAEKPGSKPKVYTLPMPTVGQSAPSFSGVTVAGESVSLDKLIGSKGLALVFGRTSCPFSAADIPQFKDIADRYAEKGVNVAIVNQGELLETIAPIYEKGCGGVPVIWDKDGSICKTYGVDAVPFYFLLDKDGKVLARGAFTHSAAVNSVNSMLGLKSEGTQLKSTEGG